MIRSRAASKLRVLLAVLGCGGVLLAGSAAAADEQDAGHAAAVAAATAQAAQWLGELDAHQYAESWEQTAEVLKQRFSQDDWTREVGRPREALGRLLIREQKEAEFSTRVRGALTGQYVTVTYLTQFANTQPLLEKVLLKLDDDGRWRVAGYDVVNPPTEPAAPNAAGDHATASPKE